MSEIDGKPLKGILITGDEPRKKKHVGGISLAADEGHDAEKKEHRVSLFSDLLQISLDQRQEYMCGVFLFFESVVVVVCVFFELLRLLGILELLRSLGVSFSLLNGVGDFDDIGSSSIA